LIFVAFFCEFQLDHFSFTVKDTFRQRYLVYDNYWKGTGSPIFFYTGNEGDIVWFYNNTVSMFTHCTSDTSIGIRSGQSYCVLWVEVDHSVADTVI